MSLEGLADCSYVTASAHKFGGPKGVGFLILPEPGDGCQILLGGAQEDGHRAGTEDVAGVLAMMAALSAAHPGEALGRDAMIDRLCGTIPGLQIVGVEAPRLWNTVSLVMPAHHSARWIRALEKSGFLLSAGSACSTGKSGVSAVLLAMGIDATAAARVLRVSAAYETTTADWLALADAIIVTYQALNDEARTSASRVISID
jgi:cysteine desulfurase